MSNHGPPMPSAYHRGFGHTLNYNFEWLPEDPDAQVAASIRRMIRYIVEDTDWPQIRETAMAACDSAGGDPIQGVWNWIKPRMKFRQDAELAHELMIDDPRIADTVEVFVRPIDQDLMIRANGFGMEDCDGFELYAACLLTVLGVPVSLVTIAADDRKPGDYSHVYLAAYPEGRRIPLDFSHGPHIGWESPNLGRKREWPVQTDRFCAVRQSLFIVAGLMLIAGLVMKGAA
jgi:hypothetical protein